jgi:hypothetical protein
MRNCPLHGGDDGVRVGGAALRVVAVAAEDTPGIQDQDGALILRLDASHVQMLSPDWKMGAAVLED